MIRLLMTVAAAATLIAAPLASADAASRMKPAKHRMVRHHAGKPGKHMMATARSRDGGSAAVDALNEQSLSRARGGQ